MRAEVRRRAEQHHVDAAVEQLLVGVEADEPMVGLDVDLAGDLLVVLEDRQALLEPVLEGVGHGDELDVRVGGERLGGGAGAAAAAADQADAQHVAAGRVHVRERGQRPGGGGGREESRREVGSVTSWRSLSFL